MLGKSPAKHDYFSDVQVPREVAISRNPKSSATEHLRFRRTPFLDHEAM
jgi:hypothetical protein